MAQTTEAVLTAISTITEAVAQADTEVDLSLFLRAITIRCHGTGEFSIEVDSIVPLDQSLVDEAVWRVLERQSDAGPDAGGVGDLP